MTNDTNFADTEVEELIAMLRETEVGSYLFKSLKNTKGLFY